MAETRETFEGWAILELMGHRRLGGYVTEVEIAGTAMLRIDVPDDTVDCACLSPAHQQIAGMEHMRECPRRTAIATQFYSAAALYCLTPTTEEAARIAARAATVEPVTQWEVQRARGELAAAITSDYRPTHLSDIDPDEDDGF